MKHHLRKVLITGSSGFIGRTICPFLESHGFTLRGFDKQPAKDLKDFVQGNLKDMGCLRNAVHGMDSIIHLAACSDEADFVTQLVPANVIGAYNVFEAARLEKISQVILASSIQVVNMANRSGKISCNDRFPTNHYGLLKIWAEDLGEMYSRLYGLSVIAARIGWFVRNKRELEEIKETPGGTKLFLSHNDTKEFFLRCLLKPEIPFAVLYALSRQPEGELFDMGPARQLVGFEPRDIFPQGLTFGPEHVECDVQDQ